jgi:hypothetical protein
LGPGEVVRRLLGPLDGARIPGGCERCDAFHTVRPETDGFWVITIHHDDDCPELARQRGRR